MAQATLLTKKTKTDLLEEYNKLLEQYEELKMTARIVGDPQSAALLGRTKDFTVEKLTSAIGELRGAFNESVSQLSDKLLAEAGKLNELQQAIELSKKNLELNYHIQVGAETLERLVQDYETKKRVFGEELELKK